jgi:hypothetical protein
MITKIEQGKKYVLRDGRRAVAKSVEPSTSWPRLNVTFLANLEVLNEKGTSTFVHCVWGDGDRVGHSEVSADRMTDVISLYGEVFEPEQLDLF